MKSAKRQVGPLAFLAKVGTGKTIQKYRKRRIIYAQGEEADKLFYIQSGKVKVTVVSKQGKEAVVGLLEHGQLFWRGMPAWTGVPCRYRGGNGKVPYHLQKSKGDVGGAS